MAVQTEDYASAQITITNHSQVDGHVFTPTPTKKSVRACVHVILPEHFIDLTWPYLCCLVSLCAACRNEALVALVRLFELPEESDGDDDDHFAEIGDQSSKELAYLQITSEIFVSLFLIRL